VPLGLSPLFALLLDFTSGIPPWPIIIYSLYFPNQSYIYGRI